MDYYLIRFFPCPVLAGKAGRKPAAVLGVGSPNHRRSGPVCGSGTPREAQLNPPGSDISTPTFFRLSHATAPPRIRPLPPTPPPRRGSARPLPPTPPPRRGSARCSLPLPVLRPRLEQGWRHFTTSSATRTSPTSSRHSTTCSATDSLQPTTTMTRATTTGTTTGTLSAIPTTSASLCPPHGYDDPLVVFRDLRLMGFGFADLNPVLAARVHRRLVQATTRGRPEGHCVYHAARKFPGQKAEVTESDDDSYEEVPWVPKGDSIRARRKWSTARKSGLVGGGFPVYGSFGPSGFEF